MRLLQFGDALSLPMPTIFHAGFDFDGRLPHDFKLARGTWVSVRSRFLRGAVRRGTIAPAGSRRPLSPDQPRTKSRRLVILDL